MDSIAAFATAIGQVELVRESIGPPETHQVQLKALCSSLSPGTEHALIAGKILPLPQAIGYSLCAEVTAIGQQVSGIQVGDTVVATARHAQWQNIDYRAVTVINQAIAPEQACLFNLAHTALYGIRRSELRLGEPALVLGCGLVGLLAAQLAKAAGAAPIIALDINDTRIAQAKQLGLDYVFHSEQDKEAYQTLIASLKPGLSVVYEATGHRQPLELAAQLLAERGRLVMLSTSQGGDSSQFTEQLMMKGATLIGGYINSKPFRHLRDDLTITDQWPPKILANNGDFFDYQSWSSEQDIIAIMQLLQCNRLTLTPLISHRFRHEQIPEAYQLVWQKSPELLAGIIEWNR